MTSPAEPASTDASQARQLTKPLRELAALVLLGANAVLLFVGLLRLLTPTDYGSFTGRAGDAYFAFVGLEAVALPVLAVLLATHLQPVVPKAKLITQVALAEYAASALFGALTFLIWTVGRLAEGELLEVLLGLLTRLAWLAIFAVAAYVVFTIWRAWYYVPKPKPQPGVYGSPQPGWPQQPGGWPGAGQPGGHPVPGQPAPGQPHGYPAPNQPGGWAAPSQPGGYPVTPHAGQPGAYGQPAPPFGAPPQSAPPFNPTPQSAPPANPVPPAAPPFGQPPSADPTQAIPRQPAEPTQAIPRPTDGESDRTQRINPGDDPDTPR
ncbi:hypothetical protein ACFOOK_26630 [Micromonospora krabiensis]|uniref:Uncharacterized protein n=1 Tax=Micromonospora krabiensis TaxID=307121 RepID=A0A1C3N5K1_9ACTN|nr:hypothetical protein [Micromonospora krabiensis]SBV27857.1 hypothetical protein GA0070620_3387 [Micromonospora krabiensis]